MTTEKPQRENREETTSTTTLLREERLSREQKMAREKALLDEADEVRYAAGAFRPRHAATVEDARAAVDALVVARRAMPEPAPPPVVEPPAPPVDEAKRAALAPLVAGEVVAIETRFRVSDGEVVEATYEADGTRSKGLFVLTSAGARPFDDLGARIDALPLPAAPPASPSTPPPVEERPIEAPPAAPPEEPRKKGLGRFKLGKDKPAEAAAPPEPAEVVEEKPKKGLAARLRRDKPKAEETPAPAPVEDAPPAESEKTGKRRFSFGRK